jgi:hypothetical protein
LLRSKKKKITNSKIKGKAIKDTQLQQVNAAYSLLDAHIYIKCNSWSSAIDSIYAFLNQAFNYIPFKDITNLIEGAFYRALFNYYIYRNDEKTGVLIPDYAMKHLEPNSNY